MRLNKLWFYYLSIAIFFVFLCFFVFCCSRVKWLSLDNWGTERIFRCFGPARTLAWYCWNNCSPQFLWKWGIFTSTSVNNTQPNILGYCATTDGEERLEITWPSKVFNASFYRGEEVCHINHLPAEGIVIMTQSRWWESHFRILWDAIVSLEYRYKIIINSFTQKLVGLIY